jgi:hypothetical protein
VEKYPILNAIVRFGARAAIGVSLAVTVGTIMFGLTALGWWIVPIAAFAGAATFIAIRSYVELVMLVCDMLMPR